jgi:aspartyl-tRNA synthetase
MYEWNEEEKKIDFSHNPFSMPNMPAADFLKLDPDDRDTILGIKAIQYDIVCNGIELSSGAIRNHRPDVMKKAFAIAGYGEDYWSRSSAACCSRSGRRRTAYRAWR